MIGKKIQVLKNRHDWYKKMVVSWSQGYIHILHRTAIIKLAARNNHHKHKQQQQQQISLQREISIHRVHEWNKIPTHIIY